MTREEIKYYSAGKHALGKGPVDPKHLEIYVDGAMMVYDLLNKKSTDEKLKTASIVSLDENGREIVQP